MLLEKLNGGNLPPGSEPSGVRLYDNGAVVRFDGGKETPLAQLDAGIVTNVQKQVDAMVQAELVKLDPKQGYNPSGFTYQYSGHKTNGDTFVFQKNVSGVDFGFADKKGYWPAKLLDSFGILNTFSRGFLPVVRP